MYIVSKGGLLNKAQMPNLLASALYFLANGPGGAITSYIFLAARPKAAALSVSSQENPLRPKWP